MQTASANKQSGEEVVELPMAGQGARLVNALADSFAGLMIAYGLETAAPSLGWHLPTLLTADGTAPNPDYYYEVLFPVMGLYYLLSEALTSRTIGKLITRTMVVSRITGERPTFGQILLRTLLRLVPFEYLWLIISYRSLHDLASGTLVVERGN